MIRDMFQGGACNATDQQQQSRQINPLTQFIDQTLMGPAEQQQHIHGHVQSIPSQGIQDNQLIQRQNNFQTMEGIFTEEQKAQQHQQQMHQHQMHQLWQQQQQQVIHEHMLAQQHMTATYEKEQLELENQRMQQQFKDQLQMDDVYEDEAQQEIKDEVEQAVIQNSTGNIIQVMQQDPDPKFQNSKFLAFLRDIQEQKIIIQGDQLVHNEQQVMNTVYQEQEQHQHNMNQAMAQSNQIQEQIAHQNEQYMNQAMTEAQQQYQQDSQQMNDAWQQEQEEEGKLEDYLDEMYRDMMQGLKADDGEMLSEAWQKATDLEEQSLYAPKNDKEYLFKKNNPYINDPQAYLKGISMYNEGKVIDAILYLEGHLQQDQHQQDAQAWRVLGRILQDNDQDQPAVACLLNALEHCTNEDQLKDTLYNLGISCTNILDEVKAMNYLAQWLRIAHPNLPLDMNIFKQDQDYQLDDVRQINHTMIDLFQQALLISPHSSELCQSLSVLQFINRDYQAAVGLFQRALQIQPDNFSLWNKLGATYAHLGQPEQAVESYNKALDIKPNYVRVWVNLGIANAFQGDYHEAARFYLTALNLNPEAKHLWTYLHSTFVCMQRYDLLKHLDQHDLTPFRNEFDIIDASALPGPEIEYAQSNMQFVIKKAEDWVEQIVQQQPQP